MEAGPRYAVLVADDHPLVRAGVRASLEADQNYTLVGESSQPEETVGKLLAFAPQLLILDIMLGKDCSLFWLDRFQAACPQLRILVLSSLPKGDTLKLLQHPAVAGFVLKQEAPHFLLQAIRVVASGGNWYSEAISSEVRRLAQFSREGQCSMLTSREQEVFDLLKTGKNNGDIAAALNISVNTVRRYVTHIYQKMGVTSRVEAILVDQALESRHGGA